jgi:hypothetical protein
MRDEIDRCSPLLPDRHPPGLDRSFHAFCGAAPLREYKECSDSWRAASLVSGSRLHREKVWLELGARGIPRHPRRLLTCPSADRAHRGEVSPIRLKCELLLELFDECLLGIPIFWVKRAHTNRNAHEVRVRRTELEVMRTSVRHQGVDKRADSARIHLSWSAKFPATNKARYWSALPLT